MNNALQMCFLTTRDVLIQCGTNHAWRNRSKEPCMVAFILIDGDFDPALEAKFKTAVPVED